MEVSVRSLLELGTLYDIMPGTPSYDVGTVCTRTLGTGGRTRCRWGPPSRDLPRFGRSPFGPLRAQFHPDRQVHEPRSAAGFVRWHARIQSKHGALG